jgi:hypothetical protein
MNPPSKRKSGANTNMSLTIALLISYLQEHRAELTYMIWILSWLLALAWADKGELTYNDYPYILEGA